MNDAGRVAGASDRATHVGPQQPFRREERHLRVVRDGALPPVGRSVFAKAFAPLISARISARSDMNSDGRTQRVAHGAAEEAPHDSRDGGLFQLPRWRARLRLRRRSDRGESWVGAFRSLSRGVGEGGSRLGRRERRARAVALWATETPPLRARAGLESIEYERRPVVRAIVPVPCGPGARAHLELGLLQRPDACPHPPTISCRIVTSDLASRCRARPTCSSTSRSHPPPARHAAARTRLRCS